ncbi:MAG: PQQ-like beta-propeller repeat protein [Oscillospiraceae bacterium]|nr:PQQ-like beta-propeller repeat protein [Oscillospiraceae bacterium]
MRKKIVMLLCLIAAFLLCGCGEAKPAFNYEQAAVHSVAGRQGICTEDGYYWVSGSGTLTKYDSNWNVVAENTEPFEGYTLEVNHIGDIDVYNNELYLGVEYFMDGEGKNIQVAVYDGDTLKLKRVFPFRSDTGQLECSGIAVDADSRTVYMTSWIDDESSEYLYMYDLDTGDYKGKLKMQPSPKWLQGIAYFDGNLYVTSDDGDADENAPDHMYRIAVSKNKETGTVSVEKAFDDVIKQGEIEGLTFDKEHGQFLLLYNRGARIIAGMPSGFYEGYSEEIHEVFVYDIVGNK